MPRKVINALAPLAVKNAKPGRHADGGGLHLLVKPTSARSWFYRYMINGKLRDAGRNSCRQPGPEWRALPQVSRNDGRQEADAPGEQEAKQQLR